MEEKTTQDVIESPSMMTYIIGAVLVLAVIAGAWYFRSKSPTAMTEPLAPEVTEVTPTPGPITKLACDQQYFNPKVAFPEYYLSIEGGDVSTAKNVSCEFTAYVNDKKVATATAESPLTAAPERGGSTFRCTTEGVKLAPDVATVIDVSLQDDLGETSTCAATFTFPTP